MKRHAVNSVKVERPSATFDDLIYELLDDLYEEVSIKFMADLFSAGLKVLTCIVIVLLLISIHLIHLYIGAGSPAALSVDVSSGCLVDQQIPKAVLL
ncbi:MAG: hypothetical protein Q8T09_02940 [Candidatus Melainabacteria bacterium]|nr:hypothetical protein [Candidatus Melainabacteria bacterium]